MIRWARQAEHMRKMRNAYTILIGSPKGDALVEKIKTRREYNIKVHLWQVGSRV
jgi:hypothetical protein